MLGVPAGAYMSAQLATEIKRGAVLGVPAGAYVGAQLVTEIERGGVLGVPAGSRAFLRAGEV
jgi:hypothetical protein